MSNKTSSLLVLCALLPACDGRSPELSGTLTAEATLTVSESGGRVDGTAKLVLARPAGPRGQATVTSMSTDIEVLRSVFVADDPDPIDLDAGEQAEVTFHFSGEAGPSLVTPNPPWGRTCEDPFSAGASETFVIAADIFDTVTSAGSAGQTRIEGQGSLTRTALQEQPPAASLGAAWSTRFGGKRDDVPTGVAIDSAGNVIVVGQGDGTLSTGPSPLGTPTFFTRVGAGGNVLQSLSLGAASGQPRVAAGGDVEVVAGSFNGATAILGKTISGPPNHEGAYAARIDPMGKAAWIVSFAGQTDLYVSQVLVDPLGNVTLAGTYYGTDPFDLGGGPLSGTAERGGFVLGLDASGAHRYARRFDGVQAIFNASADAAGGVVMVGTLVGPVDFGGGALGENNGLVSRFAAKLDENGDHLWSRFIEGTPSSATVAAGGAGDTVIASSTSLLKLDPTGAEIWERPFGDAIDPSSVAIDDAARVFVGGTYHGNAAVQQQPLLPAGEPAVHVLAAFDAQGSVTRLGTYACSAGPSLLHHRAGVPGTALAAPFFVLANLDQGPLTSAGRSDTLVVLLSP